MSTPPNSGDAAAGRASGLLSSLRAAVTTLVATAMTRIELIGNELEFERDRLIRLFFLGLSALFCLGLGTVLLIALLLVLYWDARVLVLSLFCAGSLLAAAFLYASILRSKRREAAERVFSATLAELEEDIRQLRAASRHAEQDK